MKTQGSTQSVTIRDVAKLARVAVSTASLALNGRSNVKEETRSRVLNAAKEIGYQPNRLAQGLRSGKTRHIAVLVPDIANQFYGELVSGIMDAAAPLKLDVIVAQSGGSPDKRESQVCSLIESMCTGIILLDAKQSDRRHLERAIHTGVPVVQVVRYVIGLSADVVRSDEFGGGFKAMQHAISLNHSRLAIIAGPRESSASRSRLKGNISALRQANLGLVNDGLYFGNLTRSSGYSLTKKILNLADPPSAIVCSNDLMAFGAIDAIADAGQQVPQDVSVLGYDDIDFASVRPIGLTTIHQPLLEMGKAAVKLLVQRLAEPELARSDLVLPTQLVQRRSCLEVA